MREKKSSVSSLKVIFPEICIFFSSRDKSSSRKIGAPWYADDIQGAWKHSRQGGSRRLEDTFVVSTTNVDSIDLLWKWLQDPPYQLSSSKECVYVRVSYLACARTFVRAQRQQCGWDTQCQLAQAKLARLDQSNPGFIRNPKRSWPTFSAKATPH